MKIFNRIVFLDIDGVLQPGTQDRFDYRRDMPALCRELELRCGGKYPYSKWCPSDEICAMDLAAVYYDWDRDAVERLRYALGVLDAGIVLSSSWREDRGVRALSALLGVHGLDNRLVGSTETPWMIRRWGEHHEGPEAEKRARSAEEAVSLAMKDLTSAFARAYGDGSGKVYVSERTVEIREYLDRHPEITSYVAVDDMADLELGLDGHFVNTSDIIRAEHLEKMLDILSREDGPYSLPAGCLTPAVERMRREAIPLEEDEFRNSEPIPRTDGW